MATGRQMEYERRAARELAGREKAIAADAEWRALVREARPALGRLTTALTPKPVVIPGLQPPWAWPAEPVDPAPRHRNVG